jgi:hypothetical protein
MLDRGMNPQHGRELKIVFIALLIFAITFSACDQPPPPPKTFGGKLPPPLAYSSADYADGYDGHTVLVDSFAVESKADAYYLAGQLRAAQTRSFVVARPNQQLYVCVGNNRTRKQAERIRDYLNSRYELGAVVLKPEPKPKPEE